MVNKLNNDFFLSSGRQSPVPIGGDAHREGADAFRPTDNSPICTALVRLRCVRWARRPRTSPSLQALDHLLARVSTGVCLPTEDQIALRTRQAQEQSRSLLGNKLREAGHAH